MSTPGDPGADRPTRGWTLSLRRSLACGAMVTLCSGCTSGQPTSQILRSELLVRSLVDAVQSADTALIIDLFRPDASYDDFANQVTYEGLQEIVGYLTSVHSWGDDVYMNIGRVQAGPSGATAEWVFSAVQARPMGDLAPEATGREVVLSGATVIEIDGDRIVRAADYMDTTPMLLQLGARIELPGGRVLTQEDSP